MAINAVLQQQSANFETVAWILKVWNTGANDETVAAKITFVDSRGYALETVSRPALRLKPRQVGTFTDQAVYPNNPAQTAYKVRVDLETPFGPLQKEDFVSVLPSAGGSGGSQAGGIRSLWGPRVSAFDDSQIVVEGSVYNSADEVRSVTAVLRVLKMGAVVDETGLELEVGPNQSQDYQYSFPNNGDRGPFTAVLVF